MEMQALTEEFGPAESGVRAVGAGCDLLLYCGDLAHAEEAREGLRQALSSGERRGGERSAALAAGAEEAEGADERSRPAQ